MTKEEKIALMRERLKKLEASPKNIKCGGVVRKLRRQLRNYILSDWFLDKRYKDMLDYINNGCSYMIWK